MPSIRYGGVGSMRSILDRPLLHFGSRLWHNQKPKMEKLIRNQWRYDSGDAFERAKILSADRCSEGLDVERLRFVERGRYVAAPDQGHIITVISGRGTFGDLQIEGGVHLFVPAGFQADLQAEPKTELVIVSSKKTRGRELILRDEMFVAACASPTHSLRWILTPQYLSRRIFLHHDPILLSQSGHPVSWFHTTMFDVSGLPQNEEGQPVFKMSYNSRTEFNVCYDVQGAAGVRMAQHPYKNGGQAWQDWLTLDGDSTYHLNETTERPLRNKHEVSSAGHVSLYCLFDPAPTGVERHRPGEYSDYEPLDEVIVRKEYETHRRELARFDAMADKLSLAKAKGELESYRGTDLWTLYEQGRQAQAALEMELINALAAEGKGRDRVIERWMLR